MITGGGEGGREREEAGKRVDKVRNNGPGRKKGRKEGKGGEGSDKRDGSGRNGHGQNRKNVALMDLPQKRLTSKDDLSGKNPCGLL